MYQINSHSLDMQSQHQRGFHLPDCGQLADWSMPFKLLPMTLEGSNVCMISSKLLSCIFSRQPLLMSLESEHRLSTMHHIVAMRHILQGTEDDSI